MKFFLDTGLVSDVEEASQLGLVDGITTNPSLIAKSGKSYTSVIEEMAKLCSGPISAEVLSERAEGMMKEARKWHQLAPNIVVKIPLTAEGLKATYLCKKEGISTNITLCFSTLQALAAAKAGASYISPFVGRLDDVGHSGMNLVEDIKQIYDNYDLATEIIVASVRSPLHLHETAMVGADIATIPISIYRQILKHPLTDTGLLRFMEDAKKIPH